MSFIIIKQEGVNMSLKELVSVSNYYGSNPEFVLAGGGNTSYKTEEFLYIKGSGTNLATITEEGFVKMNRKSLAAMWKKQYSDNEKEREAEVLADLMDAREKTDYAKRPSVETSLHDLFTQKFVVHTHPSLINGLSCSAGGEDLTDKLFGGKVLWINETAPGYVLALAVREQLAKYMQKHGRQADIMIIQNHGIFIAADTVEGINANTSYVTEILKKNVNIYPDFSETVIDKSRAAQIAPAVRMLLMQGNATSIVTFRANKELSGLVSSRVAFESVASAYTPDHIVYCRHESLYLDYIEDIDAQYKLLTKKLDEYKERNGFLPKIIAVESLGIFAWGQSKKEADIVADVFLDAVKISVYSKSFGGYRFMGDHFIKFIVNWEVESYRRSVSLSSGKAKRLIEKIALVTGSAQGFGKGIADEMAAEGANLVIADLNYPAAKENADNLCETYGTGKAIAAKVDVSSESDVENMVIETALSYGGLDVLVSNAGILKAGGLEEMPLSSFELITKINYTAYFIVTKHASRIMKIQNRFKNEYYTDIIQINSKSGLAGSNKNFAYAGGKFGGIGLTQSFALELVEYRIKVNSICPGNFFDGPLWSDPEKGLFVQYLKTGKVPGAKTIDDVKRSYEAKVPMGRGCEIMDVARAIFYIIEQEYETGQAIPVTGGQNMLK